MEEQQQVEEDDLHISIHALAGVIRPRTMKTQTHISKKEVIILIYNGSSINFINSKVVDSLELPMTSITPFKV